jgi:hypothetical protein
MIGLSTGRWTSSAVIATSRGMAMLSVIILCGQASAEAVVRTLVPLVAASVRGLLRDVVLAGPGADGLALVADHAGCGFIEASEEAEALRRSLAEARSSDVMILRAGYIPESGFLEELEDVMSLGLQPGPSSGPRLMRAAPETLIERLWPGRAPVVGLLAPQALCQAAASPTFATLHTALKPRQTLERRMRRIA